MKSSLVTYSRMNIDGVLLSEDIAEIENDTVEISVLTSNGREFKFDNIELEVTSSETDYLEGRGEYIDKFINMYERCKYIPEEADGLIANGSFYNVIKDGEITIVYDVTTRNVIFKCNRIDFISHAKLLDFNCEFYRYKPKFL